MNRRRLRLAVRGAVQGVGFRPFVHRLASELGLTGYVQNDGSGAVVEVEGDIARLEEFLLRMGRELPPNAAILGIEPLWLDPAGFSAFEIHKSSGGQKYALILPDIATCAPCLHEVRDPSNRRFGYPFTNCTHCGPRFSILEALPYDRERTTMRGFRMCDACHAEYDDPHDRRFHAQPNACPVCGPQLAYWDAEGNVLAQQHEALQNAANEILSGRIVAVKGLGGFHLLTLARDHGAVHELRQRKRREEKPLAIMCPSLEMLRAFCAIAPLEEHVLQSPEAPIVLLRKQARADLANAVAPGNPYLGVMLPYTPLHHLLLDLIGAPLVATSGNLSDEPLCTDEREALRRLRGIADRFLVHDRPIARPVDDSIVQVVCGREMVLRRARGYAPLPIALKTSIPPIMAVGAHLKNTVALSVGRNVFLSQHLGDLETEESLSAFQKSVVDLPTLYEITPRAVACDLHPDYASTRFARECGLAVVAVQHHHAHVMACMADNELDPPVLGLAWDGTGYGTDGTIWGGEFLRVMDSGYDRVAHLRSFPLPGREASVREPRRAALGLLYECFGEETFHLHAVASLSAFSDNELPVLREMLRKGIQVARTSSVGRIFDAVSSILNLRHLSRFEGQAAMELEFAAMDVGETYGYAFGVDYSERFNSQSSICIDWKPCLAAMLDDIKAKVPVRVLAAKFHSALVEAIVAVALRVGLKRIVLCGGCFQNRVLLEGAIIRLRAEGFDAYWPRRVPPNDGSISLGQVVVAAQALDKD